MAKILETKNYDVFNIFDLNRNVKNAKKLKMLEKSMLIHGWIDAFPMMVSSEPNGNLQIKCGHHRFYVARKLGIPVKYVVCDDSVSIYSLETSTTPWSLQDYLDSYCRGGNENYLIVKDYCDETGISLAASISMLGGESAASNNFIEKFKNGGFLVKNSKHPGMVKDIVIELKRQGIKFYNNRNLVLAISKTVLAPECDTESLILKIKKFPQIIQRKRTVEEYMLMLEKLYNFKNMKNIPLKFYADEASKKRQKEFWSRK